VKLLSIAVALFILVGCAAPARQAAVPEPSVEFPVCGGTADCEVKWGRAIQWINANSHWRIRLMNESMIETFGSGSSTYLSYRVTRIPLGEQKYRIEVHAGCRNLFGCNPHPAQGVYELTRFIDKGW